MEFARMLNERRQSPERLTDVARSIAARRGFFANHAQRQESEHYFRLVFALLTELAGPESACAMAAAGNLASVLGAPDVRERFSTDDPRCMSGPDGRAFLYRHAGDSDLCEHLQRAEQSLRDAGAKLSSPCVQIHDHRGTNDGSERGLVCSVHQYAVMGAHPADASAQERRTR
jgi:hypothetical protein